MAALMGISNAIAILMCNAAVDALDGGAGAATIAVYGDTRATDVDTAVGAQTLLGTLTCSDPAFGDAVDDTPGALATASAITADASADNTDTATWFRASTSAPTACIDGNVGTSSADMILNTVAVVAGAEIAISAWTVFQPES
jgi:hypothetical protein